MTARIDRVKRYMMPGMHWRTAWKWLYRVSVEGREGTREAGTLPEARRVAKWLGADEVIESWRGSK